MFFYFLADAVSQQTTNSQSIVGIVGTVLTVGATGGGVITVAVSKMFDTKRIGQIIQLQGKIEALEWKLQHREEELIKTEKENEELRGQIDNLRDQSNSSINSELIEIKEKYNQLFINYKKLAKINKTLKENKS